MIARLALIMGACALLAACNPEVKCSDAPECQDNTAVNCDPTCTVGPCSNSPQLFDCGDQATCQVLPGEPSSTQFFRSRAACVLDGSEPCDPVAAPPPTCDGLGNVQGCGAQGYVVSMPCNQAPRFFAASPCCSQPYDAGVPTDGGIPDGGTADGGSGDGGL